MGWSGELERDLESERLSGCENETETHESELGIVRQSIHAYHVW